MPRLILPALLVFFCLGFVFLDSAYRRLQRFGAAANALVWAFTGYTLVACTVFAGFLS